MLSSAAAAASILASRPASAIGFKKELKKRGARSVEDYSEGPSGLQTVELTEGSGTAVKEGDLVTVHFDTIYKGIDVASSRSARLLGGNRTLAEPLSFTAGKKVGFMEKTAGESAGGLFSGQSGPKPPPALSVAVLGMKPGGKRSVLVPPELAYGKAGYLEIPANAGIELRVALLSVDAS